MPVYLTFSISNLLTQSMDLGIIGCHSFRVRPFLLHVAAMLWLSCLAVFFLASTTHSSMAMYGSNETDLPALLSFKSMLTDDPMLALASWNTSIHFCKWHGVICEDRGGLQRVTALGLDSLNLAGTISPSIANLTFLQNLSLSVNELHGPIPQEIGFLSQLQHLNLSINMLQGEIPHNLGHCSSLSVINLNNNNLTGAIPRSVGTLRHLTKLMLQHNLLQSNDWAFLSALANCSSLSTLDLSHNKLGGMLPTSIANLSTRLQQLALADNQISGNIPFGIGGLLNLKLLNFQNNQLTGNVPMSIGRLSVLSQLNFSTNQLSGFIPLSLANLSALTRLDLANNNLTGRIPTSLGNLNSLSLLQLNDNNLAGNIPPSFSNLSALNSLRLSRNNLVGEIPSSLGDLSNLKILALTVNFLSGTIPFSVWNLTSLEFFHLRSNNLSGTIPPNMGQSLNKLVEVLFNENQFHGTIPTSLSNASSLTDIEMGYNKFSGNIPQSLGKLQKLSWLVLARNELGEREATDWSFLTALTNNTRLKFLSLANNRLGGNLPKSVTNLSISLEWLWLGENQIYGTIPTDVGRLINLRALILDNNLFEGSIPATIGMLKDIQVLDLSQNQFSGVVPPLLGNLTKLNRLSIGYNYFNGSIPATLGSCLDLEQLDMEYNRLTGTIPNETFNISTLSICLNLANNMLEGPIPPQVQNLINLVVLDVSNNKLSGVIPADLSKCLVLQELFMGGNLFHGPIPSYLRDLKGLQQLDLSLNNLDGLIPEFLELLPLTYLNLSFNDFEGEVPKGGVFANASAFSINGNTELCGGNPKLHLPPCKGQASRKRSWSARLTVIIIVVAAIFSAILLLCLILICSKCTSRKQTSATTDMNEQMKLSYAQLVKATDGFSSANLIGTGSFGSVYKGILEQAEQKIVAVKVLNLQQQGAFRSFTAECDSLRNSRHRNLVKILTSCSSIDFQGNDFKALVFEFLPNWSLERWLHPSVDQEGDQGKLSLTQRLDIAIDVASAIEYLHHHHPMPIIHCDLKPSNVLLDNDMTAHVGDFGLARFLSENQSISSQNTSSFIQLKGSIGYIAPEYGMGYMVSTHGDIYSYGILVLEMLTGKRPTDEEFKEGMNLHNFVVKALPDRLIEIVDPFLLFQEEDGEASTNTSTVNRNARERIERRLLSFLTIGIRCSEESPVKRLQIGDVTRELHGIRNEIYRLEHGSSSKLLYAELCQ